MDDSTTSRLYACIGLLWLATAAPCRAGATFETQPSAALLAATEPRLQAAAPAATEPTPMPRRAPPRWPGGAAPLDEWALDRLRGGFQGPHGLRLNFGIERMVSINGELTTRTRVTVAGPGSSAGDMPARTASDSSGHSLVRNGAGNAFLTGAMPATSAATVIQNTLDGQHIRSLTIINAQANSLDVLRSWRLQMSIRDSVTGSLRR